LGLKAKAKARDRFHKAEAKDLKYQGQAKAKDLRYQCKGQELEVSRPRPRT